MSLTGNLEDLPLLDIIQIVSFSKKTGSLAIRAEGGEAAIVFADGLVVCAFTWNELPLEPTPLPAAEREARARARIGRALEQLIRLREGEFNFALAESVPTRLGTRDLRPETLANGINPQELLLDLARGMDEDRRDSSAVLEASFASPDPSFEEPAVEGERPAEPEVVSEAELGGPAEELAPVSFPAAEAAALLEMPSPMAIPEAAPEAGPARRLLLVDDEDDVRAMLAERFVAAGWEVHEAGGPDEAIKVAGRLVKAGQGAFALVTDLNMPASGGASFHGGFEVVKRLWKMNLRPPVLMMADSLSTALRSRAKQMGVGHFAFKPGLSKLDARQFKADLQAFAARLVRDVLPAMEQPRGPQPPEPPRPAAPRTAPSPAATAPDEAARQMRGLQAQLEELRQHGDPSQISLLVMRVAREHFERAALFLVKNDELRGLAGFGSAPHGESLNLLVRDVVIPLAEPSLFQRVVVERKPFLGELPDGKGGGGLLVKLGRFQSRQVALLPLVTHRQTMAVLFGDNPETGREPGRLEALEVFLDQAGTALEHLLLQRKLQALQA